MFGATVLIPFIVGGAIGMPPEQLQSEPGEW
jgi:xanthine/uracil permease